MKQSLFLNIATMFSMLLIQQPAADSAVPVSALSVPPHLAGAHAVLRVKKSNKVTNNGRQKKNVASNKAKPASLTKPAKTKANKTGKVKVSRTGKKRAHKRHAKLKTIAAVKTIDVVQKKLPKLSAAMKAAFKSKFAGGIAGTLSPDQLLAAGVFTSHALRGGIFHRSSQIENIVVHSTETGSVADAPAIIDSWNHGGKNHPGTQFMVDRDGVIYETVDPEYATFHVNSFKTLQGVKNDNSIGIEIVRTGTQKYTAPQLKSVVNLVAYLKERFQVSKIWGHGQIQPSDRSDPVAFDWMAFNSGLHKLDLVNEIAMRKVSKDGPKDKSKAVMRVGDKNIGKRNDLRSV